MTKATRPPIRDFGFNADESPYHFVVIVKDGGSGEATIEERFAVNPVAADTIREPIRKVVLDSYRWSRIAGAARAEFNQRLENLRQPTLAWRTHETLLAPHFGKELTLLAWAVEEADPTVIPNVIANWRGLAPEERWWLYTTVNATAGHPDHGKDRGWRKAIKIALAENPSEAATPGTIRLREGDVDQPDVPRSPRTSKRRGGKRVGADAQLSLIGDGPL